MYISPATSQLVVSLLPCGSGTVTNSSYSRVGKGFLVPPVFKILKFVPILTRVAWGWGEIQHKKCCKLINQGEGIQIRSTKMFPFSFHLLTLF